MAAILLRARPKVPVSFEDVSVYFTKTEWNLLSFKQRVLYKQVMLENYNHLVSVGCAFSKPHLVSQLERGEKPWIADGEAGATAGPSAGGGVKSKMLISKQIHTGRSLAGAHLQRDREGQQGGTSGSSAQRRPQDLEQNPVVRRQRPRAAEKRFLCQQCGKSFSRSFNLAKHRIVHSSEKPYECEDCGKLFRRSLALLEHQRLHSGEKPYECAECGKTFTRSFNLLKHQIVHSDEMPFACSVCGKVFRRSFALLEHTRIHSGERPYACEHCGKAFSRSSNLIEHQRTHSGRKPYACRQCGKAFKGMSQLIHHRRCHSGDKAFTCQECGKAFRGLSGLSQHQRVHSGEKPYECSECGKAFGRRTNLFKHQVVHGGVRLAGRRGRAKGLRRGCMLLECRRGSHGPHSPEAGEGSSAEPSPGCSGQKPYACEHCSQAFLSKLLLIRHQRIQHGTKPHAGEPVAAALEEKSPLHLHLKAQPKEGSDDESSSTSVQDPGQDLTLSPEKQD